jgi:dUTP pyrophosphatase
MLLVNKISRKLKMSYQYRSGDFASVGGDPRKGVSGDRAVVCQVSPGAKLPVRAHPTDAGADMFAYVIINGIHAEITIQPGTQVIVDTGIAVKIPAGYAGFIMPRSSMRSKGITGWGDGLIDPDYRGTVKFIIANQGTEPYKIVHGDRIGQMVIKKIELVDFIDGWNDTARGDGGFGSTGK